MDATRDYLKNPQGLGYWVKVYEGLIKMNTQTVNRAAAYRIEADPEFDRYQEEQRRYALKRMRWELKQHPLWTQWLAQVRGVSEGLAGRIIWFAKYRTLYFCHACRGPITVQDTACPACGAARDKAKEGLVIEEREFETVSKLWAFAGLHVVEGKAARRQTGQVANWSANLKRTMWLFEDSIVRAGGLYRQAYDRRRVEEERKAPELRPGIWHQRARRWTAKLFLAHLWEVDRALRGLPAGRAYVIDVLGHTHYEAPYYFGEEEEADGRCDHSGADAAAA